MPFLRQCNLTIIKLEPLIIAATVTNIVSGVDFPQMNDYAREVVPAWGTGGIRVGRRFGERIGGVFGGVLLVTVGACGVWRHVELKGEVELRVDFLRVGFVVFIALW